MILQCCSFIASAACQRSLGHVEAIESQLRAIFGLLGPPWAPGGRLRPSCSHLSATLMEGLMPYNPRCRGSIPAGRFHLDCCWLAVGAMLGHLEPSQLRYLAALGLPVAFGTPSWGSLGPFGTHLGCLLGHLGAPWGSSWGFLGLLGLPVVPSWGSLGRAGPLRHPKSKFMGS